MMITEVVFSSLSFTKKLLVEAYLVNEKQFVTLLGVLLILKIEGSERSDHYDQY